METISFKLNEDVLNAVDNSLKPLHFNNRTEFIREAIRDKLNNIEVDLFMKKLEKYKGKAKISVSDERLEQIREEVAKKYFKDID